MENDTKTWWLVDVRQPPNYLITITTDVQMGQLHHPQEHLWRN